MPGQRTDPEQQAQQIYIMNDFSEFIVLMGVKLFQTNIACIQVTMLTIHVFCLIYYFFFKNSVHIIFLC